MRQLSKTNAWLPEIFNDFINTEWMPRTNATAPAINVIENEQAYIVELAAPGMNKQDFSIQIDKDNDLVIKMEKKSENESNAAPNDNAQKAKNVRYLRREFAYSKYQQTLILPEDVDIKSIKAKMENGILAITLQKIVVKEEPKVCKEIEIA